ncbi:tryptophan 2,3-dioxygenase [Micromonospora sagamiensis]|uniref:Tryptophan 2,3-dioxygenase n=1 Tax=Micromonospora sagamiensis TaxID=47875 RepID=A0A562WBY1_9ACTN|nr:tryptophan 2,3-dioxygenase family protein [Micromonospora sagamiensis]TWJ27625.1 tryptophan 2,3-dioxygenase [Micromonospora sagamiensis]BCL13491.1 tryptophan 2,3-dioxygenase [Micromonospora sagamiensis]
MEKTDLRAPTLTATVRPVTPRQRAVRAARNGGSPTLEFTERVPYDAYVHASTLHTLQQPLSGDPGEMSFLMVSQIMELYFGLTCHELREAQRLLRADRIFDALAPLRRTALHLEGLNAAWQSLRWMTPADFNRFRDLLGEGSGFQSAKYRELEFLLGLRDPALIRPFRRQTEVYAQLRAVLDAPSVWDDVIALLARHGFDLPTDLLDRDVAVEHESHPLVESAWVNVYGDAGPDNHLRMLGEALTTVAEEFGDWRYQHLKAVQRAMGAKVGSGGSAGLSWLRRSMERVVFPELWSARTAM